MTLPTRQTKDILFRLASDTVEQDLLKFVRREVRFLHDHLDMSFTHIAEVCGVSNSTIGNLYHGKSKHPQVRTMFPILANLNLEFDPVTAAIRRRDEPRLKAV